jgi:hypothetical protein
MVKGSLPTDKEREDNDGNRWWLRRSDSLMLPAPLFFELDTLINWVTLKEKTEYKTRRKERKTKKPYKCSEFPDIPDFLVEGGMVLGTKIYISRVKKSNEERTQVAINAVIAIGTKGLPSEDPDTPQYPDHVPSIIQMRSTRYGKSVGTATIATRDKA